MSKKENKKPCKGKSLTDFVDTYTIFGNNRFSEENQKKIFAKKLNYYMTLNHKHQVDIVNDLGINKSTISTWCKGIKMPRINAIQALADYFNIGIYDLIEDKNNTSEFKDLIKQRRKELNLTLEDIAKVVGVSKATVQRWESGVIANVRHDKIAKLAVALHTSPDYLMGWDNENVVLCNRNEAFQIKPFNTSIRLKQIMSQRNLKQIDIINLCNPLCKKYNVKLAKNDLSQYVNNKAEPGQKKISILAEALNVSEAWLIGYDVPMDIELNITDTLNDPMDKKLLRLFSRLDDTQKQAILVDIALRLSDKNHEDDF